MCHSKYKYKIQKRQQFQNLILFSRVSRQITDCGSAPSVVDSTISTTATTYDTYVYYSCKIMYVGSGSPDFVRCKADGQWTLSSYICQVGGSYKDLDFQNKKANIHFHSSLFRGYPFVTKSCNITFSLKHD